MTNLARAGKALSVLFLAAAAVPLRAAAAEVAAAAAAAAPDGEGSCPAGSAVGREGACVPRQALLQVKQVRAKADLAEKDEAAGIPGFMTMWSDSPTTIVGGSCEYANGANGGLASKAAASPYVSAKAYCAVDGALYGGGASCGNCYRVSYDGSPATDPGRPGSLIVQVVDSGSAKTFDCQVTAFETITRARTGVFPITYEPVDCDTHASGATVMVLDGNNAWYTKVIFSNTPRAVVAAELMVNGKRFAMGRNSGATWKANTDGTRGAASFKVTLEGGATVHLSPCFADWPVSTGSFCNRAADPTPGPTPAPVMTPAPTPPPATPAPAPGQLPSWTGQAPWERVDGGVGRACRGAHSGDNSNSYYTLHAGVPTLSGCKSLCLATPSCAGLEHNAGSGRCEVWTRTVGASKALAGYTCLSYGAPATPPPTGSPSGWEEVDGSTNRVCRGANSGDNSASYYTLHSGTASLDACKALCSSREDCTGVEFRSSSGRCEVWTRAIDASRAAAGFACLRRVAGTTS